jgi:hypothetical protein
MQRTGAGCIAAFGLPFLLIGIGVTGSAVANLAAGASGSEPLLRGAGGLVFALVGAGIISAAVIGHRLERARLALRTRHPEAPWRWRPDWDAGRVTDASRATMLVAWGFALFWNSIAWISMAAAMGEVEGWRLAAVALFPAVGAGLLVWAVRETVRYRRFGASVLELATLPGVIGLGLAGTVHVPSALHRAEEYRVTLRRIERTTSGSGRNRRTHEFTRWEEQASARSLRGATGVSVPVSFRIPAGEPPSTVELAGSTTVWRLEVRAEVPGVDYAARFEVPVFAVPAGSEGAVGEDHRFADAPSPGDYRQPRDSAIRVSESRRGTEIYFPAARNPGAAIGLTAFLAIWCAATGLMTVLDAPLIFPIVFGLFALLLGWGALQLWLGTTHVTLAGSEAVVRKGLAGTGREQRVSRNDVAAVEVRIGMQAGGRAFYDVWIVGKDRRKVAAGSAIANKREAEWVAHLIERGLGMKSG